MLRVELVTGDHLAYAPPVLTDETITVVGRSHRRRRRRPEAS